MFNTGTTMFASRGFKFTALLASLAMAFSMVAVDTAEARRGGSFGSRGFNTQRVIPATPTSPKVTTPLERTMTNGTTTRNTGVASTPARPSLFGGFGGALLGGLLFSGLFGMLFGYGFGGFGGMLALLVQLVVVGLIINWFFRRRQVATAGGAPLNYQMGSGPSAGSSTTGGPRSSASRRAGGRDQVGITDRDLSLFETRLGELQDAYSREDYAALRRITTPEVMSYLAEELGANASKGLRNEVYDVKLLEGDVAESWREGNRDYATVAMRYESRDITRNRATGEIVAGDDRITPMTEIWTFVRDGNGQWLVSAIQEA
jgi:predicted lipid-binding transport protein (Tim44 family)